MKPVTRSRRSSADQLVDFVRRRRPLEELVEPVDRIARHEDGVRIATGTIEVAPPAGVHELQPGGVDHDDLLGGEDGGGDRIDHPVRRAGVEFAGHVDHHDSIGPGDPDPKYVFHDPHDARSTCDRRVDGLWVR